MVWDWNLFPEADGRPEGDPLEVSLMRGQACEIIRAVLSGTDPEGEEIRERLRDHVAAYPGRPEAALQEHLIFTRSLARQGHEVPHVGEAAELREHVGDESSSGHDRATIEAVLDGGMLVTAFQPVYDLVRGQVTGAEALTRFVWEDGDRAWSWFKGAAAVGLGADLEFAALEAAVVAAQNLPRHLFVALNVSPAVCLDPRLAAFLERSPLELPNVVLELTDPLRGRELSPLMDSLRPLRRSGLRLAVDEAGSDAASMRQIRSLRPDVIKLSRGLIAGIDADSSCQYLVADLVEFGRQTGAVVSATGIETAAELAILSRLGVTAGQGHLTGRPTIDTAEWARWAIPATTPERPRPPTAGQTREGH